MEGLTESNRSPAIKTASTDSRSAISHISARNPLLFLNSGQVIQAFSKVPISSVKYLHLNKLIRKFKLVKIFILALHLYH